MNKLKNFWNLLTPVGKKRLVWGILSISFLILVFFAYKISRNSSPQTQQTAAKRDTVDIQDKKLLEVSEKANYQAIIEQQRKLMEKYRNQEITKEEFDKEMAKLGILPAANQQEQKQDSQALSLGDTKNEKNKDLKIQNDISSLPSDNKQKDEPVLFKKNKKTFATAEIDDIPSDKTIAGIKNSPTPPPPPLPNEGGGTLPPALPSQLPANEKIQIEFIGDIGVVSASGKDKAEANNQNSKKKESIYLPSSFMEATLLSGLDAPTVESARGNPMLTLLRIKDLAILPNKVKANLKGCFAVAEGYGNLADERAHLRLVTISCIDKKGQSIIDQKVKGYVVDADGKVGLRGKVVAKMGSMIARAFIAGFLGGFGDAVRMSSTTNMVSPLGTTSTIDTGQATRVGIGAGIAQAATELQRFYMELARQTMPVIEVGATRTVTLVISEGVNLEIKNINIEKE